jgi:hypothetical protein
MKAKTKELFESWELFSAMPPWEVVKVLFSLLVTDEVPGNEDEELEMAIFDISRAHFMPEARRHLCIELPEEDRLPGEEGMVGYLLRGMYGFRDAANGWQADWQATLKSGGYDIGKANNALFYNAEKSSRGAVHGDDFYVLAGRRALDDMKKLLESKYSVRESHRLGFGAHCVRQATALNRIIQLGYTEEGKKFLEIEADSRHAEMIIKTLGLDGQRTKPMSVPGTKLNDVEVEQRKRMPALTSTETTLYRSNVMRAAFLAQDRGDIGDAVRSLAQGMSKPTDGHMADLKHLGRYLVGHRNVVNRFVQQKMPTEQITAVDSDYAADKATRKSITGMSQRLGAHTVKTTSNMQTSVGLNVSECEFYAIVHGGAHGLGLRSCMQDWGISLEVVVESDSNAAKSFASRRGLGKQRHVQTRYLWIQERVASGEVKIRKVPGTENVADILTKVLSGVLLWKHMATMGFSCRKEKNALQKGLSE